MFSETAKFLDQIYDTFRPRGASSSVSYRSGNAVGSAGIGAGLKAYRHKYCRFHRNMDSRRILRVSGLWADLRLEAPLCQLILDNGVWEVLAII